MIAAAKVKRAEDALQLAEADAKLAEIEDQKAAAEKLRDSAEAAEKEVKDFIEAKKVEKLVKLANSYDEAELIGIAFKFLDTNKNDEIAQYEISSQKYLDPTPENSFLPSEAKTLLKEKDTIIFDEFVADLWPEIREKIIPKLEGAIQKHENAKAADLANAEREARETSEADELMKQALEAEKEAVIEEEPPATGMHQK